MFDSIPAVMFFKSVLFKASDANCDGWLAAKDTTMAWHMVDSLGPKIYGIVDVQGGRRDSHLTGLELNP